VGNLPPLPDPSAPSYFHAEPSAQVPLRHVLWELARVVRASTPDSEKLWSWTFASALLDTARHESLSGLAAHIADTCPDKDSLWAWLPRRQRMPVEAAWAMRTQLAASNLDLDNWLEGRPFLGMVPRSVIPVMLFDHEHKVCAHLVAGRGLVDQMDVEILKLLGVGEDEANHTVELAALVERCPTLADGMLHFE
jgi:hypothetical protein